MTNSKQKYKLEEVKNLCLSKQISFLDDFYKNNKFKHRMQCLICNHLWSVKINAIVCGRGCPKCGIKRRSEKAKIGVENFIKRAKEIHGDKYDYSMVDFYENQRTPLKIICKIHGIFVQN